MTLDRTKRNISYTVKKGDDLIEIVARYNTKLKSIASKNDVKNVNLIYIG